MLTNDENKSEKKKEDYCTQKGEKIPYQLAFDFFNNDSSGPNIQRQNDRDQNPSIRRLKQGEYASVEIKYSIDKNFVFDGNNKIESYEDVAFLFKKLEQSAIENAFVVYVKNKKPIIQHMSMGSNVGTVVWFNAISDGVSRFKPEHVYFIHNHPSGNIRPSSEDVKIIDRLKEVFPEIMRDGIIIDIDSGYFSTFNSPSELQHTMPNKVETKRTYKVLKFDKQTFNRDVDQKKVLKSDDAASLISSQRLSGGAKISLLVLNRTNQINANLHLSYSDFKDPDLFTDISAYTARFGGTSIILYGRFHELDNKTIKELKANLLQLHLTLLDVINIKSTPEIFIDKYKDNYNSMADDGLLEEQYKYAVAEAEALYNKCHKKELTLHKIPDISTIKNEIKINDRSL